MPYGWSRPYIYVWIYGYILQVTLVATTDFTLDWIRSKHHLSLLAGFYFENYSWTYTRIQKKFYNIATGDHSVSSALWKVPSVNILYQPLQSINGNSLECPFENVPERNVLYFSSFHIIYVYVRTKNKGHFRKDILECFRVTSSLR
jgi:hypothetical protein